MMAAILEPHFSGPQFYYYNPHPSSQPLHNFKSSQKLPQKPNFVPLLRSQTTYNNSSTSCSVAGNVDPPQNPSLSLEVTSSPDRTKDRRKVVRLAWEKLVRWSRSWRSKAKTDVLERTNKVVVLGGGSFGTAMAAHIADRKAQLEVNMLVRDPQVCRSINDSHFNCKYFPERMLPDNVVATTDAKTALLGADFCLHAVPVQFSSSFLKGVADYVDPGLPFISLSKGLELNSLRMMSQIIPRALKNPRQPFVVLSGPSFASELMNKLPTAMVVASKDKKMAHAVQQLLASSNLRINTSRSGNCRCTKECIINSGQGLWTG